MAIERRPEVLARWLTMHNGSALLQQLFRRLMGKGWSFVAVCEAERLPYNDTSTVIGYCINKKRWLDEPPKRKGKRQCPM